MNENQNDQGIIREYGVFSVGAWLIANSESAAFVEPSHLATENEAGEINAQAAPIQTPQRKNEQIPPRGPTGPRTELGKRRSSQNVIKFGMYSKATLLKGESRSEYQSLLDGLWEAYQPAGKQEELLVEKLASIQWRYQRLLLAEGAEIQKASNFSEYDRQWIEQVEAEKINLKVHAGEMLDLGLEPAGLIWNIHNSEIRKRCIGLLVFLRERITIDVFDEEQDGSLLKTIYGDPDRSHIRPTLHYQYSSWLNTVKATEKERQSKGYATPEQCKQHMLQAIATEIAILRKDEKKLESIKSERRKVELLRQDVPDSRGLDRLLRYESSLERAFDRTLTQLERLQRIRNGQPLPPQLDVKIS